MSRTLSKSTAAPTPRNSSPVPTATCPDHDCPPPTVYGRVTWIVSRSSAIDKASICITETRKYTSLIHVEDLVRGMIQAATSKQAVNRAYFLCNDQAVTWKEFQTAVKKVMRKRALTLYVPSFTTRIAVFFGELSMKFTKRPVILNREKAKLGRPSYWIASNKRARRELRFNPEYSMEEGLAMTWRWYKQNGWLK